MTFTHQVSASLFHYGGCAPGQVTISVAVSDPAAVRSVILFTRLEDQQSRQQTPWDEGTSMVRAGTGRYQITLNPNSIANYKTYDPAWLLYQFVATNSKEEVIARSPRIYDVTISACGSAPAPVPVPRDIITVTPVKPFPILPVIPRE